MRFMQDDDCQWYLIPADMSGLFWQLEENGEADYWAAFFGTFNKFCIDHPSQYIVEIMEEV